MGMGVTVCVVKLKVVCAKVFKIIACLAQVPEFGEGIPLWLRREKKIKLFFM